jgi:putative ABC transport system substrate-binding protein
MTILIRRREFIGTIAGAVISWPLATRAQSPAMPVVGFLHSASPQAVESRLRGFLQGLKETGYVEGQNVAIEYRWANDQIDRLPELVADLVLRKVTVIAATTTPGALAAQAATTTIPIVFETGTDPVQLGLVGSLNQPGGNVTGVTNLVVEIAPKRLELLHEVLPTAKVMALLVNPADRALAQAQSREVLSAARRFGMQLHVLNVNAERDFDAVFANLTHLRVGGIVIAAGSLFVENIEKLAALTTRHAMPAIHYSRDFVAAGGLISYGSDVAQSYRLAGVYTGRILRGEKPGNLPVQQPTKFDLYLNLKTAKALGLTFPVALLGRADEVVE